MKFTIHLKPLSVNEAWQGRRFKTSAYKDFERDLLWLLPTVTPIPGPVELRVKFHMRNVKNADWDNPIKPLQDILKKKGILIDDRFVYRGIVEKVASATDYFEVQIVPFEESDIFAK